MTNKTTILAALAALALAAPIAGCTAASSSSSAAPPSSAGAASRSAATSTPSGLAASAPPSTRASAAAGTSNGAPAGTGTLASCRSGQDAAASGPALDAIEFVGPDQGWVAGAGRILATGNGGETWTRQYAGGADLDQVDFIDGEHGWAAGGDTLLRTVTGGASWTALAEPCTGDLNSVHFVSPDLGYAIAAGLNATQPGDQRPGPYTTALGGSLLRTTDGGAGWAKVAGAPANPQSVCFGTADDGYLGTPGRIWRTTDGGRSWTLALAEPAATGNPSSPADAPEIECAGASGLWALFLGYGAAMNHAPYLAYATQDGHDWHGVLEEPYTESGLRPGLKLPAGPGSAPGPFSAIDPGDAVFVGYTPPVGYGIAPVMTATDNGYSLTKNGDVGAINEAMAAAFLSQDQGWVVGENLKTSAFDIEATGNGGRTWTTQYTVG